MNYKSLPYDTVYFNNPIDDINELITNELITNELYYVEEELMGRKEGYVGLIISKNVEKNTFVFKPLYQRSIKAFVTIDKKRVTLGFNDIIIIGHRNDVSTHSSEQTLEPKSYMCEGIMNESNSTMVCDNPEHRVHLGCVNKYYKEYNPKFACELCRIRYLSDNDRDRVARENEREENERKENERKENERKENERKENERKAKEQMNIDIDSDSEDDLIGVHLTKKQRARDPIYTREEIAEMYPAGVKIIKLDDLINRCVGTIVQAYVKTNPPKYNEQVYKNNEDVYKNIGEFKLSKINGYESVDLDYTHESGGLAGVSRSKTNPYLFVVKKDAPSTNKNCIISGGKIKRLRSKRRKYKKTCKSRPRKKHLRTRRCKSTRKRR